MKHKKICEQNTVILSPPCYVQKTILGSYILYLAEKSKKTRNESQPTE